MIIVLIKIQVNRRVPLG